MKPSDPTVPQPSDRPDPRLPEGLEDDLLDLLRGELPGRKAQKLETRLAEGDPALRQERDRLATFLRTIEGAEEPASDPATVERIAWRVRDQVTAEEALRERQEAARPLVGRSEGRRRLWGRIVAVSVAAHVALLGVFAWQQHRTAVQEPTREVLRIQPIPGLIGEEASIADVSEPRFPAASEWGLPDQPRLPEGSRLPDSPFAPSEEEMALAPIVEAAREHPRAVALEMAVRRIDDLKRRRLDRFGLDASGTLTAVSRGLQRLGTRQHPDGSFRPGGGRSAIGETGLALLPFLAEGEGSADPRLVGAATVVGGGIAWLRAQLFARDGTRSTTDITAAGTGESAADLGLALRALSEDYMLSYGRLSPAGVQRRAQELRALTLVVASLQEPSGAFPGADADIRAAVWPMWGLEAAIRTGVVPPPAEVPQRFQRWYATAPRADPEVAAAGLLLARALGSSFAGPTGAEAVDVLVRAGDASRTDPFLVAIGGSGLLLRDPDAYRAWNDQVGARLLEGLGPTGLVREGDEVGDTALQLLALQAAYRTY